MKKENAVLTLSLTGSALLFGLLGVYFQTISEYNQALFYMIGFVMNIQLLTLAYTYYTMSRLYNTTKKIEDENNGEEDES